MHILLVDDNPADARLIREYLGEVKDFHFEITHAPCLDIGLEYLAACRPEGEPTFDIILFDLPSPGSEDLDSLRCMRAATHLPIIVQSGIDNEELALKVVQEGAQDFLIKGQLSATLLARTLRYSVERQHYEAVQQRRALEMEALYANTLEISAQLDLKAVLHSIVERAARLLGMQMGGLYLVSADNQNLQLVAGYEISEDLVGATLKIGEGLAGRVVETGESISVEDYHNWQGRSTIYEQVDFRRVLAVPLKPIRL